MPDDTEPNDGITLVMANHVNLLPDYKADKQLNNLLRQDKHSMQNWQKVALTEGIEVDSEIWDRLQQLAARILVESSDGSRQGAGAGTNDND